MSKHTPAPWTISARKNVGAIINGHFEVIAAIGDMPCIGGHDDLAAERGLDMEIANATLIAAAPDLLAALNAIVAKLNEKSLDGSKRRAEVEAIARAAIAKAKGQQ